MNDQRRPPSVDLARFDAELKRWMFAVAPTTAPARLLEDSFARTSSARQLRAWPWHRAGRGDGRPAIGTLRVAASFGAGLALVVVLVIIASIVLLPGLKPAPTPAPTPTGSTTETPAAIPPPTPGATPPAVRLTPDVIVPLDGPFAIAAAAGKVWVLGSTGSVSRIDAATGLLDRAVTLAPARDAYQAIAADASGVWITDWDAGTVIRLDPTSLATVAIVPVGAAPKGILVDTAGVWVALTRGGAVVRIDPASNVASAGISVGPADFGGPNWLAGADETLWVGVPNIQSVVRIDEATRSGTARITIPPAAVPCGGLAVASTDVWLTSCDNKRALGRIDRATNAVSTIPIDGLAYGIMLVDDRPWLVVASSPVEPATIVRIDPGTSSVDRVLSLERLSGGDDLALAGAWVWVVDRGGSRVVRLPLSAFSS